MKNAETKFSNETIAQRAYEIYLRRNGQNGNPEQDWLQAEAELTRAANSRPTAAKMRAGVVSGAKAKPANTAKTTKTVRRSGAQASR